MNVTDTRLKIAVFIDFDNVEIGVKSTIGGQFDIGLVLEAIKERGEIVTKIAYSDWKRAGDYSRLLTLHAIRMVQRNLTPGGDKNGADITMALDALEMAFTHDHISAFVIVGQRFSIGDIGIATQFVNFRHAGYAIDAQRWPKLARYVAAVHARPSFMRLIEEEAAFFGTAA